MEIPFATCAVIGLNGGGGVMKKLWQWLMAGIGKCFESRRLSRQNYLACLVTGALVGAFIVALTFLPIMLSAQFSTKSVVSDILTGISALMMMGGAVIFLCALAICICFAAAKRLRDLDVNGWVVVPLLAVPLYLRIPLLLIVILWLLAVVPGKRGENRYGPPNA